jgi:hypothetical protein
MTSLHPLQCRCGAFQAQVSHPERSTRAVCYCKDCQAFAHFLGLPEGMLDGFGGTDVVAVRPRDVAFVRGRERLACMSLTPSGTLRWYAACCRTPIGNTPRDPRQSHVGLIHTALETRGGSTSTEFGPVRMHVNRQGAKGKPPKSSPAVFTWAVLRYLSGLLWSRWSGRYKRNPFFDAGTGQPIAAVQVLSPQELARLRSAV